MSYAGLARKTSDAAGARSTDVPRSSGGGLRIGETNDVYEREAERVADEVMAGAPAGRDWSAAGLTGGPSLQRKCACGGGADGECEDCKKRGDERLRRKSAGSVPSDVAPPVVHDVLNAPGQPLDRATRDYFEPRFGHDFSRVRVHADERAAESARAVAADAYTVGHHIVLGAGQFAPTAHAGRKLLAHELAHVRQQESGRGAILARQPWRPPKSPDEVNCATLCGSIASMRNAVERLCNLAGEDSAKCTEARKTRAESEERIVLSKCSCDLDKGAVNKVNKPLSEEDKKTITTVTKAAAPTGPVAAIPGGTRFVLHDSGMKQKTVAAEKKRIAEHQRDERGPLDHSAAGWVTSAGDPFVARPKFFDSKRPTATEFEKRSDLLALADREKAFQKVWTATQPAEQTAALDRALAGLVLTPKTGESKKDMLKRAITDRTLTPDEAASEKSTAATELGTPVPATRKKGAKPLLHTTAAWTVGELCAKAATAGVKAVAVAGQEKDFTDGCSVLQPYLAAREPRLGSMTNVEIMADEGSDCRTTGKLVPFPAYDANVFTGVASLYLQAALQAGSFPEITTHFWVDRKAGDHCDPRCFDLNRLYGVIASTMGHPKGSTYGLKPIYGVAQGVHNVWWLPKVCGGSPPP